jgi:hypothetical protein
MAERSANGLPIGQYTSVMQPLPLQPTELPSVTIAARTVVLESSDGFGQDGDTSPMEVLLDALTHWRIAAITSVAAGAVAFTVLRSTILAPRAEGLVRVPVDEGGDLRSDADASRSIDLLEVTSSESGRPIQFTTRRDKGSELLLLTWTVQPRGAQSTAQQAASKDLAEIVAAANAALAESIQQVKDGIDSRIQSLDISIAEAKALVEDQRAESGQSSTRGVALTTLAGLRTERAGLEHRLRAGISVRAIGEVRVVQPKLLSASTVAPPLAAIATFFATAFLMRAFWRARARRGAAETMAGRA